VKLKSVWQTCLVTIMLAGFAVCPAVGQQTGVAAKPAQKPASPSQTVPPTTGGTPSGATPAAQPVEPPPDKVVLKVGAAQVTRGDVDFLISNLNPQGRQALAMRGRRPLADEYVKLLVLSQAAESDHLESVPTVRERIELQRQQTLANAEYEKLIKDLQPSPEEVTQYFTAHQPDFEKVQARQIMVRKRPEGAKPGTLGLTADEARAKAEAIRKAVVDGTDMKKVTEQFNVPSVVTIDAEPRAVRHRELLPALDAAAFSLKDGEVSQPIDMPQAVVLVQVTGHVHSEQKEVAAEIENTLKQQKLEAKLEDLKKKSAVWMDEQYFTTGPATPPAPGAAPPTLGPQPPATGQAPKK
jgi:hypothetical protein